MNVAFASIVAFAFVFALFVGTSLAQEIVAASYTDGTCTTVKTNPQTLQSGQCVYSSDFNFWYTIKAGPNNTANYFYNCTKGCAESSCALKGSSTFGSCPSITMGNGQIVHVDAFRVETKETIDVRVFSDAQCGQQLDDVGTIALASGQCQYMKSFGWSLMVSHVNPNDAPPSRQLAYRANCNSDCTKCTKYGRMELNKCTLVEGSVWVNANLDTSAGTGSGVTLEKWELALIIVGSAVGGALFAFLVSGCLCCMWRATRRHHDYSHINH